MTMNELYGNEYISGKTDVLLRKHVMNQRGCAAEDNDDTVDNPNIEDTGVPNSDISENDKDDLSESGDGKFSECSYSDFHDSVSGEVYGSDASKFIESDDGVLNEDSTNEDSNSSVNCDEEDNVTDCIIIRDDNSEDKMEVKPSQSVEL